jgi:hypothetical protein
MKALVFVLAGLLVSAAGASAGGEAVFPSRIPLPNGFQP